MSENLERLKWIESKENVLKVVSDYEDENGGHPAIEIDSNAPGLFIMDIDGTMIDARKIHGPAVIEKDLKNHAAKFFWYLPQRSSA